MWDDGGMMVVKEKGTKEVFQGALYGSKRVGPITIAYHCSKQGERFSSMINFLIHHAEGDNLHI